MPPKIKVAELTTIIAPGISPRALSKTPLPARATRVLPCDKNPTREPPSNVSTQSPRSCLNTAAVIVAVGPLIVMSASFVRTIGY